jgi:NNP family nitrate/nitrite transporter-like MFS transporter
MANLQVWNPEDGSFWDKTGRRVANRNLAVSVPALLLSFSVWMVWSAVVVYLPQVGFQLTTDQLFWLTAIPSLSGATLRIFYSFMVPIFGGRNWTVLSTASLLLPVLGIGHAVQDPGTSFGFLAVLALLCGFGSGNFASSMSNINFFFPKRAKGTALGLNAGLGNLGVSVVQFTVPAVITTGLFGGWGGAPLTLMKDGTAREVWLQNAGYFWVPLIAATTVAAFFFMDNLATAKASFREQSVIFRRKHNWIMCWLYIGTFGSFIGYSAAFPLLIKTQFPGVEALKFAFLGPLVGALIRPVGGWISDKWGGAKVTFWNFLLMGAAVLGVMHFVAHKSDPGAFQGFLVSFLLLFLTAGVGNGSTFRMIPVIFLNERSKDPGKSPEQAVREAAKEASAVLGFSSAIGAYGGFLIPNGFRSSLAATGSPHAALTVFLAFYATCVVLTWWYYSRKGAEAPC